MINVTKPATFALGALLAGIPAYGDTLTGNVRTEDGSSIKAVIVILYDSDGITLKAHETDDEGTFSIELDSGAVAAAAKAADRASHEIDLSEDVPSSVQFTLRPLTFYRGTVTDSDGSTVSGASVRVRNADADRKIYIDSHSTAVTDSSGEFVVAIPGGSSDRFVADIDAAGWVPQSSSVLGSGAVGNTDDASDTDDGPTETVAVQLELTGATVSGHVTSPTGSSLSGITVLISVTEATQTVDENAVPGGLIPGGLIDGDDEIRPYGKIFRARTTTDGTGNYEVAGLPPGDLSVVAIKRETSMTPLTFTATEGSSHEADFIIPD